jgi:hypothetical protein
MDRRLAEMMLMADDQPFYAPNAKPLLPRVARPGEPLFSFVRGHDWLACELRYHGEMGRRGSVSPKRGAALTFGLRKSKAVVPE